MKKVAIILLINIYALSVFGFSLKQFYCCGKLKTVSFVISENVNAKCSKGDDKSDCCKTKIQHYKVKDNHFATDFLNSSVNHSYDPFTFPAYIQKIHFSFQQTKISNYTHAPPLYSGIPAYISNCVYLI